MSDISSFESVFRRALRSRFEYDPIDIDKVLIITDLDAEKSKAYTQKVQHYLPSTIRRDTYEVDC